MKGIPIPIIAKSQIPSLCAVDKRKRIFLVDDHPVFRLGLADLIESDPCFRVCGEAFSFSSALAGLREIPADAAIVDISIGGANGLELLKYLRVEHPGLVLLVFSMHHESHYALRALRAGASSYLMKSEPGDLLLESLHQTLAGNVFVSPTLNRDLLFRISASANNAVTSPIERLSDREVEVLELIGEGMSTVLISKKLHISSKTVETHRLHLKKKLGFDRSLALVHFAMRWREEQSGV